MTIRFNLGERQGGVTFDELEVGDVCRYARSGNDMAYMVVADAEASFDKVLLDLRTGTLYPAPGPRMRMMKASRAKIEVSFDEAVARRHDVIPDVMEDRDG